jgi:probable addiction module antidote protein
LPILVSKSDDPALFLRAIGHIARSKGMSQIAEKTGLGRESLYKALDEKAHPRFETIFKVLNAMGIQMTLVPKMKFRKRTKQKELLRRREKGAVQGVGYSMYKKIR